MAMKIGNILVKILLPVQKTSDSSMIALDDFFLKTSLCFWFRVQELLLSTHCFESFPSCSPTKEPIAVVDVIGLSNLSHNGA